MLAGTARDELFDVFSSALLSSEQAADYTSMLNEHCKREQLLDADTMVSVQSSLDARNALGQSSSEAKPPLLTLGKFDVEKLLHLRFAPRAESAQPTQRTARSTSVTVRLGFQKHFHPNLQESFFVGEHPIAISLNYDYVETFFCYQMAHHRLILMGPTKISFVSRGSHAEQTTPIQFILGTVKDGLLAGTWCEYSQRLILVGNAHMYFYDPQEQKRARRIRCEPVQRGVAFKRRFLGCSPAGSLFYGKHPLLETGFILIVTTIVAYKSSPTTYNLDKYDHPPFAWLREDEPDQGTSSAMLNCKSPVTIAGRIAAMTVTYNQVALVYRTFESVKKFSHSVAIFDHNLDQGSVEPTVLPAHVKWVTAITWFGTDDQYLLCDPRGQQLLLFKSAEGTLTRRFRLGAVNACCVGDGRLALWIQKQYPSSPTGKIHFISAPHVQESARVPKSWPLLP